MMLFFKENVNIQSTFFISFCNGFNLSSSSHLFIEKINGSVAHFVGSIENISSHAKLNSLDAIESKIQKAGNSPAAQSQ